MDSNIHTAVENTRKQKVRTILSYEQKLKIYKTDRHKFKRKDIATYYKIDLKTVDNIIEEMRQKLKYEKLIDTDVITILENKAPETVNKVLEAKAELMTAESQAQLAEANIKNTVHSSIETALSNNQQQSDKRTDQLNNMLEKQQIILDSLQAKLLDAIDSDLDTTAIASAINAVSNMIDKITNTLLKMNSSDSALLNDHFRTLEHYGLSKKQAGISINNDNRSLTLNGKDNVQKSVSINLIQHTPDVKRIIPADVVEVINTQRGGASTPDL